MNLLPYLIASSLSTLSYPTSLTDYPQYDHFCYRASRDAELFARFKSDPSYRSVLEHVTCQQGREYLQAILDQAPELLEQIEAFRKNDSVGSPETCFYRETGKISPTTLRYLKVASDLNLLFGSSLDGADLIEIGGGYGGQCKIIADLFPFKSYTIVDLPGPIALTKKFLETLGVQNVIYKTFDETMDQESFDLVVSNYAYTECSDSMQEKYCKEILSRSQRGYMICTDVPGLVAAHRQKALERLSRFKIPYELFPEHPCTNPDNYLVVWKEMPK